MDSSMDNDPIDLGLLLQGEIFTFSIGLEKTNFNVHVNAVAKQSNVLDRLMNGSMKEATQRLAELSDIDVETFMRFASFCYTGSYKCKVSKPITEAQEHVLTSINTDDWFCFNCGGCIGGQSARDNFPFCSRGCSQLEANTSEGHCPKCGTQDVGDTWTLCYSCDPPQYHGKKGRKHGVSITPTKTRKLESKVFQILLDNGVPDNMVPTGMTVIDNSMMPEELLCHAKLVVFADRYNVMNLKTMSLVALAHDMARYPVNSETITSVTNLLKYAYENSCGGSTLGDGKEDILRKIVTEFAAGHIYVLKTSPEFWKLLEEGGELAVDLFKKSVQ